MEVQRQKQKQKQKRFVWLNKKQFRMSWYKRCKITNFFFLTTGVQIAIYQLMLCKCEFFMQFILNQLQWCEKNGSIMNVNNLNANIDFNWEYCRWKMYIKVLFCTVFCAIYWEQFSKKFMTFDSRKIFSLVTTTKYKQQIYWKIGCKAFDWMQLEEMHFNLSYGKT